MSIEVIEHNICGQICPSSLLLSLKEINKLKSKIKSGAVCLKIITDNRDAINTIPSAVEMMGFDVEVSKDEQSRYVITIKKHKG